MADPITTVQPSFNWGDFLGEAATGLVTTTFSVIDNVFKADTITSTAEAEAKAIQYEKEIAAISVAGQTEAEKQRTLQFGLIGVGVIAAAIIFTRRK